VGASVRRLAFVFALPLFGLTLLPGQALAKSPPHNTGAPSISTSNGLQPMVGSTLIASPGTWTGSPTPTYTYEWYECDSSGDDCADTGVSGNTYVTGDSDYAETLDVVITATNSVGSSSAMSSVYISQSTPTVITPPTLSGGTQVGDTLTATQGSWSGYPAPTVSGDIFVWWDCAPTGGNGTNCTVNDAATDPNLPTYTLTAADAGYTVQVEVIVDNGDQESAWSNLSGVVTAASPATPSGGSGSDGTSGTSISPADVTATVPQNIAAPVVTGTAREGGRLRATAGSWSENPTSYAYTWWDCSGPTACRQIAGATGSQYLLRATDVGYTVEARVKASNSAGDSAAAASTATATVGGPTAARLASAIARVLPAAGTTLLIPSLLEHGGYASRFSAPGGGTLRITWTGTNGRRKYMIATFNRSYLRAGASPVDVRLTAAGKRLLKSHRRIMVSFTVAFTPTHQKTRTQQHNLTLTA